MIKQLNTAPVLRTALLESVTYRNLVCNIKRNYFPAHRNSAFFNRCNKREGIDIKVKVTFFPLRQKVGNKHINSSELPCYLKICSGKSCIIIVSKIHSHNPVISGHRIKHCTSAYISASVKRSFSGMHSSLWLKNAGFVYGIF